MTVVFGPRAIVHDDRYGAIKARPNRLIVLHTTEGGEGLASAEQLAMFTTLPGDRPNGHGGMFGSSYQYVTDTWRIIPLVPENVVSYSAPPANNDGIHIVFPGKAAQTRDEWLDSFTFDYIGQCALLMDDIHERTNIPLEHLTDAEILAGRAGYCDHHAISRTYGQTNHTDVGSSFPWDVLASLLTQHPPAPPTPPEPDMQISILTLVDSEPKASFLGLANDLGGFLEVYWINGNNANEARLLADHRRAKAPEWRWGSNVVRSLILASTSLPMGTHSDGAGGPQAPWVEDDWGSCPYLR